jgi:acylphosphatase
MIARRFFINGMVQGVGYRYFTQRAAAKHQVKGFVRNLPDGRVETFAQGSESQVNGFRDDIATGPRFSKVDEIEEIVEDIDLGFSTFRIER